MGIDMTRELGHIWLHLHDASVTALAGAVVTLGVVIMLELRSVMRLRHVLDQQLSRVFEQLDLLRFETHQLLEGQQSGSAPTRSVSMASAPSAEAIPTAPTPRPSLSVVASASAAPVAPAAVYQNAAALAASGASSREIAERLGLAAGEARLLSSLAQARARRNEVASA
jgi:hypothetical protein